MPRDLLGESRASTLRRRLLDGEPAFGLFMLSDSSIIAEACSTLALDWMILDMEAAPLARVNALAFLQALSGAPNTPMPFVRPQRLEHSHLEQLLDLGFLGMVVPKVHSREAALAAATAARYPPAGTRGVNPVRASGYFSDVPRYLRSANDAVTLFVQIESVEAVRNCSEIAAVGGVDGLFVGCGDLAMSLGQPGDVTGPAMDDAIARIYGACREHGKIPGIFAYSPVLARRYLDVGFQFIAVGNDIGALRQGVNALLAGLAQKI